MERLSAIWARLLSAKGLAVYSLRRFLEDGGAGTAAALSYTSLLALVPLLAITFAVMSAFDAFAGLEEIIQEQLLAAMVPEVASTISQHLGVFIDNARRMTGAGILGLAVTAVLLLNTIYEAFNEIWRVRDTRPVALRVLVYWALLTLGPLMIGASLSMSGYAFAVVQEAGIEDYAEPLISLTGTLPFLLSAVGFTLLFILVPNRSVRPRDALIGALVAALLFEALKKGFGLYLEHFPSYQAIYGALAVLPIFLLWIYLSWSVLLFGAEITAALPEWRATGGRHAEAQAPGTRLALALALLSRLRAASRSGQILRQDELSGDLPVMPSQLDEVLSDLKTAHYLAYSTSGGWVLARDLAATTMNDLVAALGLALAPGDDWPAEVAAAVGAYADAGRDAGQVTLADALDRAAAQSPLRLGKLA